MQQAVNDTFNIDESTCSLIKAESITSLTDESQLPSIVTIPPKDVHGEMHKTAFLQHHAPFAEDILN